MVRAHLKQTPDDKKDAASPSTTRAAAAKKKATAEAEPSAWPCKMNGCSKVFMREADLKRHQRTTKSHTIPAFPCPQCDANFTRTDALRRHQRSRHNGVVIEPPRTASPRSSSHAAESSRSSSARSASTSASASDVPSGSAVEETPSNSVESVPASTPASPRKSYYRQHTMHPNYGGSPNFPYLPPGSLGSPPGEASTSDNDRSGSNEPGASSSTSKLPPTAPTFYPMIPPWVQGMPLPPGVVYMPPYYQPPPYYRLPGAPLIPIPHYPGYPVPHVSPEYLAHYPAYVYPMYTTVPPRPPGQGPSTAPPPVQDEAKQPPAEEAPAKEDSEDDDDDGGTEDAEGEPDGDDSSIDMEEPSEQALQRDPAGQLQKQGGTALSGEDAKTAPRTDASKAATTGEELIRGGESLLMLNPELLTQESLASPS